MILIFLIAYRDYFCFSAPTFSRGREKFRAQFQYYKLELIQKKIQLGLLNLNCSKFGFFISHMFNATSINYKPFTNRQCILSTAVNVSEKKILKYQILPPQLTSLYNFHFQCVSVCTNTAIKELSDHFLDTSLQPIPLHSHILTFAYLSCNLSLLCEEFILQIYRITNNTVTQNKFSA